MGNVIGVIASSCPSGEMMGLTISRPIAALPFGGRYRLLDFPLSNMVNSGLRTVGIITPFNYRSILDHLGAGKEWLLDRKTGGLFILPGYGLEEKGTKFSLRDLTLNADFFHKDKAEHVILCCSNLVINIDFSDVISSHLATKADLTLIYWGRDGVVEAEDDGLLLEVDNEHRVIGIGKREEAGHYLFLDMLVAKKKFLLQLLENWDPAKDVDMMTLVRERLFDVKVYGFPFTGYVGRVISAKTYFKCSMDLLKPSIWEELFMGSNKILTKIADNPPTRYGSKAVVTNSLVASGCKIEGNVENSIIFRNVYIGPGAEIKNSILMQKSYIGKNACLENVILDKLVRIKEHRKIQGERESPVVIAKTAAFGSKGGIS